MKNILHHLTTAVLALMVITFMVMASFFIYWTVRDHWAYCYGAITFTGCGLAVASRLIQPHN